MFLSRWGNLVLFLEGTVRLNVLVGGAREALRYRRFGSTGMLLVWSVWFGFRVKPLRVEFVQRSVARLP